MSVIARVEQTQLYISTDGGATWIPWDGTGGAGGAGDGATLDGANPLIKATVKDYLNSNPLAVVTVDTNGDPVSAGGGGLTDAELRASDVKITLDSESVAVTGPLTDAQLRASDVKITLDGEAVTNANLDVALSTRLKPADTLAAVTSITNVVHVDDNAGSITVDGTVAITSAANVETVGTITGNGQTFVVALAGKQAAAVSIDAGTLAASYTVESSTDGGVTYGGAICLVGGLQYSFNAGARALTNPNPAVDIQILLGGQWTHIRLRVTAYTSGSAAVYVRATSINSALAIGVLSNGIPGIASPIWTTAIGAEDVSALNARLQTRITTPASNAGGLVVREAQRGQATGAASIPVVMSSDYTLPAGTNNIGDVDVLTLPTITPPTLTKGTQGATGFSTQDLKDAGRNQTNYFMAAPVATTNAEVMQSFTGYKGGIAVGATVTPAVVTSGKTYRIQLITATIWAVTAIGGYRITLRANLSGTGAVGSPLVTAWQIGIPAIFTAGSAMTYVLPIPDGMEFAAGTGIAVGVIGEAADGTTGTAIGKAMIAINGYEY